MVIISSQRAAHNWKAGFTLAEVVVSVGILGFILTGLLAFFINAVALNEASRNLTVAVSHAQYVLEDIKSSSFATLSSSITEGFWNWDVPKVTARKLTPLKNEVVTTTVSGKELLTVTVTVTWQEAATRARSITLSTLVGGT
jgi:Tfp pilus assembly protein PilV